jgi:sigma-B regulation protein RsbU (phosphoserine phosphatase)
MIKTDWVFVKSRALGGDGFGYYWLDDHHFVVYLIDVCGHGVGPALHSARVMEAVRHQALELPADFTDPRAVLLALNDAFPAVRHRDMFFSVWYGVFDTLTRVLAYTSAGQSLAALAKNGTSPLPLQVDNVCVGLLQDASFVAAETTGPAGSSL